jgi:hypothetical protein
MLHDLSAVVPASFWASLSALAQPVPTRSSLTFLEFLLGAMITERGFITEAILSIMPRKKEAFNGQGLKAVQ